VERGHVVAFAPAALGLQAGHRNLHAELFGVIAGLELKITFGPAIAVIDPLGLTGKGGQLRGGDRGLVGLDAGGTHHQAAGDETDAARDCNFFIMPKIQRVSS
jgi:hypothetical protein